MFCQKEFFYLERKFKINDERSKLIFSVFVKRRKQTPKKSKKFDVFFPFTVFVGGLVQAKIANFCTKHRKLAWFWFLKAFSKYIVKVKQLLNKNSIRCNKQHCYNR